jgi:acetyl-CoA carboxylase biotin carboxyl carrier protein
MKIEEIQTIVQLMSDHNLTEFNVEAEEMRLCIKRGGEQLVQMAAPVAVQPQMVPQAPIPHFAETSEVSNEDVGETIDSPIVGTFYAASAPDQPPFVKVGDTVTPDTVVCIVEAMKVMNEIKAEKSGVIKKCLISDAQPVEFGQPLFQIG